MPMYMFFLDLSAANISDFCCRSVPVLALWHSPRQTQSFQKVFGTQAWEQSLADGGR
jgi:hypothetical protein